MSKSTAHALAPQALRPTPVLVAAAPPQAVKFGGAAMQESPTQRLDRMVHTSMAPLTGGLSAVSLALATADWAWHLAVSPGRQLELATLATQLAGSTLRETLSNALPNGEPEAQAAIGTADDDPRFRHEAWAQYPFNVLRSGFRNAETFWAEAGHVAGMSAHHTEMTRFFARQWLGLLTPANSLLTNPVVLQDVAASGGAHLVQGLEHWLHDTLGLPDAQDETTALPATQVGRDLAVTPGKVVLRNRLIELIRYTPQTAAVHPEPVLIVPSWIMKYYILDLSPHNSMVKYLVEQGHTVYMLSWRNPDASDHDLTLDDYLHLGIFDALRAIGRMSTSSSTAAGGERQPVHAMGYCLGGTLLAVAAAALGRSGGTLDAADLPPLRSLTLLAAQTDFSEPGELGLFIDESQVGLLDEVTRGKGYLSGEQMAGSFQFLHSRDLVWTRRMREYLMGERERRTDLMAWNADTTRMPARMHHEYLTAFYLHNALATSSYRVDGRAVSLSDIHLPVFLVGTERDHISPWRSVYKLHHLSDTEITFVLTSGGHNAGIISEPGHAHRSYRLACRADHGPWLEHQEWAQQAPEYPGSWWPAWHTWLAARSSPPQPAQAIPARDVMGEAPGEYVLQCYTD